ncbi:hypothetical protein EDC30_104193 [Paucimonas lemoignei]|uniref:DUF4129 domain-containing protein n=1 Tax=Paucimonas lemoignei TaxID=29443 RepID=A0A4V2UIU0_PAULE|nr:hypothetical protein [Paucimonas lemoignei]TCS37390.1 hypothetical protein EDC30_104193 [Paucimonas lemoignei]
MELEKLRIDLRPRPNALALELGMALLRAHAGTVYAAWLALWLPLVALAAALAYWFPEHGTWWLVLPWWLRPLLERAPLYILSRQVFGENVTWRQALRAWPRQLKGGWFRLLTWWRPFVPSRGLYQPIWQLEGANSATAAARRAIIGSGGTSRSAYWFGIACAHLEVILQIGLIAFIGIFLTNENSINPFAYLFGEFSSEPSRLMLALSFGGYALSGGIIGPIYAACCFTLYLSRRATLEAWDIEITLRQLKAPPAYRGISAVAAAVSLMLACVSAGSLASWPAAANAATPAKPPAAFQQCAEPEWANSRPTPRIPDHNTEQARLRREIEQLYQSDDLRNYRCMETWEPKASTKEKEVKDPAPDLPNLEVVAEIIRITLIAAALMLVAWLLYRYRGQLAGMFQSAKPLPATEIGGLDIRPESLPDDIVGNVLALWQRGERRGALALLYRATVSRLTTEDGLLLTRGATEADCLRLARIACRQQQLGTGRLQVTDTVTALWLDGAYGDRWPATETLSASCMSWHEQFGRNLPGKAVAA